MNNYPRKLFNYKSANDIFYENLKLLLKMLQSFLDFTDYLGISIFTCNFLLFGVEYIRHSAIDGIAYIIMEVGLWYMKAGLFK